MFADKEGARFDFSVVIAIYNAAKYLEETIDSIRAQTIGFEDAIQLILVDDGSTDASGDICLRYQEMHPNNIVYLHKENGGVSSARNAGIPLIEGRYVNFFDSDDIWDPNAFELAQHFLDAPANADIDVVSFPVMQFEACSDKHPLNYKYGKTRKVNLAREFTFVQLMNLDCFIRHEAIGDIRFDERINYMEDTLFINEILLQKRLCGVAKGAYARKRSRCDNGSLSTVSLKGKERFLVTPELVFMRLFDMSMKLYGHVEKFIQFTVAYEMQWRVAETLPPSMTATDIAAYEELLHRCLDHIDDSIIIAQKNLSFERKMFLLNYKNGSDFFMRIDCNDGVFVNDGKKLFDIRNHDSLVVHVVEADDRNGSELVLKATSDLVSMQIPFAIIVKDSAGNVIHPQTIPLSAWARYAFNSQTIAKGEIIEFRLPLKEERYAFFLVLCDGTPIPLKPAFTIFAKLDHRLENSYWRTGKHLVRLIGNEIHCTRYSLISHIKCERQLVEEIRQHKYADGEEKLHLRKHYFLSSLLPSRKEIWLITDRNHFATDGGSELFKYMHDKARVARTKRKVKCYFVLSEDSRDYPEMSKYGTIVDPASFEFKLLFLRANKVISAYADDAILQPFEGQAHCLMDLFNYQFVYLQHGVMQGDLSAWLNVLNKNIKLLPTSTNMEQAEFLSGSYGYSDEQVKLLGLARLDGYFGFENKKVICFMPTWRKALAGPVTGDRRTHAYVPWFGKTDYCIFYNKLINDSRLLEAMKCYGYTGDFYLHPCFEKQVDDFKGNDVITFHTEAAEYKRAIGEAALLVTDYSGVQFDFAYLRKPVVYAHFDDLESTGLSYSKMLFDYETQGFGPIAHTVDETVDAIIELMREKCRMSERYEERAEALFYYRDNQNCARIYEALMAMD